MSLQHKTAKNSHSLSHWNSSLWVVLVVIAAIPFPGCGDSGKYPVHGEVSFNGVPVQAGTMSFEPADGNGPTTGGKITDGHYQLAGNAAPLPGEKLVRIKAVRKTGRKVAVGPPAPPGTMVDEIAHYIPDIYNTRSTLTCEVLRQSSNRIDFNLTSP